VKADAEGWVYSLYLAQDALRARLAVPPAASEPSEAAPPPPEARAQTVLDLSAT
jgi:hypothetical protein